MTSSRSELLLLAIKAAIKGGEEIIRIYKTDFDVETKSDNTPVTAADKASGKSIAAILSESQIPVISEEELVPDYTVRANYNLVWIVDPLDGTKEYVKRNGEFAVNIALVENGNPVIGVIYAPVLQVLYFASSKAGSFKSDARQIHSFIETGFSFRVLENAARLPLQRLPKDYTVIASRSHLSTEVNNHINALKRLYGTVNVISVGSSIKQCWVAEGLAHEYPRYGTTMEWDTAAGQCILEEAGSSLIDLVTEKPMRYNRENMRNNFFIAKSGHSN